MSFLLAGESPSVLAESGGEHVKFTYLPTPAVLNWLAKGRFADRQLRAVRLWMMLTLLYGEASHAERLPQPFRYADVRSFLFATTHRDSDTAKFSTLSAQCTTACRCQQPLTTLLAQSSLLYSIETWQQEILELGTITSKQLTHLLAQRPFATVHRSIRDDLAYLADLGWLKREGQGRYKTISSDAWPQMSLAQLKQPLGNLSVSQTWEVMRSLESIAFVKPNLEVIIQSLWEQLATGPQASESISRQNTFSEPEKRIFVHLDYILSETLQEHVDTLQSQIEQLWHQDTDSGGGVIQFSYSRKTGKAKKITVYPVCLHYARRAKYLSAYGKDPSGSFGWHNYRLDRITSPRLKILSWHDGEVPPKENRQVPIALLKLYKAKQLPTSEVVSAALEEAWGFNFYLPRRLLIMRFPPAFAERYVHDTDRHNTFKPIAYEALPALINQEIKDSAARTEILKILAKRSNSDVYYRAWIRLGDINILMRLRDWRPNGEAISPLEIRQQMKEEAKAELRHYKS